MLSTMSNARLARQQACLTFLQPLPPLHDTHQLLRQAIQRCELLSHCCRSHQKHIESQGCLACRHTMHETLQYYTGTAHQGLNAKGTWVIMHICTNRLSCHSCLHVQSYLKVAHPKHTLSQPPSALSVQTCLVTFAYMAAQWPSFLASTPASNPCSHQAWPQGPRSLWNWLTHWNACRRFDDDYLVLWGAR